VQAKGGRKHRFASEGGAARRIRELAPQLGGGGRARQNSAARSPHWSAGGSRRHGLIIINHVKEECIRIVLHILSRREDVLSIHLLLSFKDIGRPTSAL
jgi:hypothetical protein